MSLEALLAENTAALAANTAAMLAGNEGRAEAIAAARAVTEKAAAPAKKAAAAAAPAAEPEKAAAATETAAAAPDLSADPVAASIAAYLGGTERPEERAARKDKVKEILTKVGATKHSEIPADKKQAFINTMNKFVAAGDLTTAAAEPEVAAEDDLLG